MSSTIENIFQRCAIYTRKSTSARLDHDVNSLVSQREISSAYITSQQFKGWAELPGRYDDGGHSGSGLDRPGLSHLMQDIEAGKIDVVVVYKIDRLTRSLPDFVRLVELFDRRNISLVSVSQAFDTSDSMGRMILNVLLTFSQFERELISDRVRDNIRTRKRHGKMHGGLPPLGYISTPDGLEIDEAEARIVRFIFDEFLRTERYAHVMRAIKERGFCSSVKPTASGKPRGGKPLSAGLVYAILQNPMYVGQIRGKRRNYPGRHQALVSRETWEAVQELRDQRRKKSPDNKETDHFLAGLLWDDYGRRMRLEVHRHPSKTYTTYVSANTYWGQRKFIRQYRCAAAELDSLVVAITANFLKDRRLLRQSLKKLGVFGKELDKLGKSGDEAAVKLSSMAPGEMIDLFSAIAYRIEISEEQVSIDFRMLELRRFLEWRGNVRFRGRPSDWPCSDARFEHVVAACPVTKARWPSLHVSRRKDTNDCQQDKALVDLIRSARKAQRILEENRELDLDGLANLHGCRAAQFARLIRINYLAPDIVTAIFDGTHPEDFTRRVLLASNVPTDWSVQRTLYGFPEPERQMDPDHLFHVGLWPIGRKDGAQSS